MSDNKSKDIALFVDLGSKLVAIDTLVEHK
jgi:hypothetical protein